MTPIYKSFAKDLINILKTGGIAVIPTDTIYGIVGSALSVDTVEKIYTLRKRNNKKPVIILISDIADIRNFFGIHLSRKEVGILKDIWPGKFSAIIDCPDDNFAYLHRGTKSLAFRVPGKVLLRRLIADTGPLIAPSANFEGEPPSGTAADARRYFGDAVDIYIDNGRLDGRYSTILKLEKKALVIIREGAGKLPEKYSRLLQNS